MSDHEAATARIEQPHLAEFRQFWTSLPETRNAFVTFFTSGLLHWLDRCLAFVPAEVNLVLLGSCLEADEIEWIRANVRRPFHHIRLPADDKTIWEFLFQTATHNFGWLDIDCFVLNPEIYREISRIEADVAINGAWFFESRGLDVLQTFLLFLNADVIRAVTSQIAVSPCTYSYRETRSSRTAPYGYCRIVTPEIVDRLRPLLPNRSGDDGAPPAYLSEVDFYDTLQVYQMVAQSFGFGYRKVRALIRQNSAELVHIGKVSYYSTAWGGTALTSNHRFYALLLQVDYVMLGRAHDRLPERYTERWVRLAAELERLGISTDLSQLRATLYEVMRQRGIGRDATARIVES